jgi:hypothetical protein
MMAIIARLAARRNRRSSIDRKIQQLAASTEKTRVPGACNREVRENNDDVALAGCRFQAGPFDVVMRNGQPGLLLQKPKEKRRS